MERTKIFDDVVRLLKDSPFYFNELLKELHSCKDWDGTDVYAKSCLNDRIRRGTIVRLSDDLYKGNYGLKGAKSEKKIKTTSKKVINAELAPLSEKESAAVEKEIEKDRRYPQRVRDIFLRLFGRVPVYEPSQHGNISCKDVYKDFTKSSLFVIIRQIKIDNKIQHTNNTQLNIFTAYILDPINDYFCKILNGDLTLIEEMNEYVFKVGHYRHEWSLTTKICKTFNQLLFGLDSYYIYDSVVNSHLDRYRASYSLPALNKDYYANYWNSLEDLRLNLPDKLKRNELDHIIWYRNK
jgi:hypothetical protein